MANPLIYPTRCNGRVTGYCVEVVGYDAVAEFHSGTEQENKINAELFLRALTEGCK